MTAFTAEFAEPAEFLFLIPFPVFSATSAVNPRKSLQIAAFTGVIWYSTQNLKLL